MAIQVVTAAGQGTALSNSVRTQYVEEYIEAAQMERYYDQIAAPIGKPMSELKRGSSVQVEFLSDMQPGTSAISEVTDIVPQVLRDATASLTPTSRGEALQASELLLIQAFTDYGAAMYRRGGKAMMESVEVLARNAATQGSNFHRGGTTKGAARTTLDAGTSGHRLDDMVITEVGARLAQLKVPSFVDNLGNSWASLIHPYVYRDIQTCGNIVSIVQYQDKGILLNNELGRIGKFRLVVSPWAKMVSGGAANANAVETTLNTAANALATNVKVAAVTNLGSYGQGWLFLGTTHETGNTHIANGEFVRYVGHTGSTVTIIGEGANGGTRFAHAAGSIVSNDDAVYLSVFGGPSSLAKVYATEIGEFGEVVGPKRDGIVDQFVSLGFKFYGGYGRVSESYVLRSENSSQADM